MHNFLENPARSALPYGFLAPCQNSEKTNDTVPRKCLNRQKDGRTYRLFYRTLPVTAGAPKTKNHLLIETEPADILLS